MRSCLEVMNRDVWIVLVKFFESLGVFSASFLMENVDFLEKGLDISTKRCYCMTNIDRAL